MVWNWNQAIRGYAISPNSTLSYPKQSMDGPIVAQITGGQLMTNVKTTTIHHLVGKRFLGVTPDGMQVMIEGEEHAKTGMNPMEVLLNALGACAAFDVVEMIRKRRLDLLSYRLELEGDRANGMPAYYTDIRIRHVIEAPGLAQKMA